MQITRDDIASAADDLGLPDDEFTIRESYSGRGMYGKTCPAVTLRTPDLRLPFLVALAVAMAEAGRGDDAIELGGTLADDAGLGVVLYWPEGELVDKV